MSHPNPAMSDNINENVPDDIFAPDEEELSTGFEVTIAEMGLVRSIKVSTAVLAYMSKLSPRDFFMVKGALGTPDARMKY